MINWGGSDDGFLVEGQRYDPLLDTWRGMSDVGAPTNYLGHTAVWTGNEMIVWGGEVDYAWLNIGGRYDPPLDVWSPVAFHETLDRFNTSAVWTGQENGDGDQNGDLCDCAPGDLTLWSLPAVSLVWEANDVTLGWTVPDPGGTQDPTFDVLLSSSPDDFGSGAARCLESDTTATSTDHAAVPAPSEAFYYLVRGQNGCGGSLGEDSSGAERTGIECPP
jgi:hypothetical protein